MLVEPGDVANDGRELARTSLSSAGYLPSNAAVPIVKPAAPASFTTAIRSGVSIEPAT